MRAATSSLISSFMDSRLVDLMEHPAPANVRQEPGQTRGLAEREVDEQRLALDVRPRHEPPVPAVLRVVAIVAHHEELIRRYGDRPVFPPRVRLAQTGALREIVREQELYVRLLNRRAVDIHRLVPQLNSLAGQ